jgi:Gpi18-like mannosyltransferase
VAPVLKPGYDRQSFFTDWDAAHYLYIAKSGYPSLHPPGGGFNATAAFFPLLPLVTRGVADVTGLSIRLSGIAVANVAALVAFCIIWILFGEVLDRPRATVAIALLAFWPASFVLSMVYSEGLFLLFAAAALLSLRHERWSLFFLCSFLATLARPDGIVLALCGALVAFGAYRRHRRWLPWFAVLGAPLALVSYFGYLWAVLGSPTAWFTAERRGLGEVTSTSGASGGRTRSWHYTIRQHASISWPRRWPASSAYS